MTISTQVVKHIYDGDGSNSDWTYTFPVSSTSDIAVYLVSPNGALTLLSSNYSVDIDNSKVVYPTVVSGLDKLPSDWQIVLLSNRSLVQETDLDNQGALGITAIENSLDKLTILVQQLKEKVDRSVKYPVSSNVTDPEPAVLSTLTAIEIGDPAVDGSWKISISGNNLSILRRESNTWVEKGAFQP